MNAVSPRPNRADRVGFLLGIGAYATWGVLPIYFKLVRAIPPVTIVAQRLVWSFVVLFVLVSLTRGWAAIRAALANRRTLAILAVTSGLIAINWLLYVDAVNNGHILAGSLGYYLNPIANILLGRFLLFNSIHPLTNSDLMIVPLAGDRTPAVFLKTTFREGWGAFSPDGRWVAYHSNESGPTEVYVRPFLAPDAPGTAAGVAGGQWQVSTAGGAFPAWRPDGKELYYLNPAGELMAAPIKVTGNTLAPGAPVALFPTRIVGAGVEAQQGRHYDVAPDGRFLINMLLDQATTPITLLQNWNAR